MSSNGMVPESRVAAEDDLATIRGDILIDNLVDFTRVLRRAGLRIGIDHVQDFLTVLCRLGLDRRADVKSAGRAVFARSRQERNVYDAAFDLFWRRATVYGAVSPHLPRLRQFERQEPTYGESGPGDTREIEVEPGIRPAWSSNLERLRAVDFEELSAAEERDAFAMLEALRPRLPRRRSRRPLVDRRGGQPAGRKTMRRSLATGGEPVEWWWRRRTTRPRPIVFVGDISGSMERYTRFLLRFAHALSRTGAPVEVFVFGTRLTRISRQLRVRSPDEALRRVSREVLDWSGGTRIGESVKQLNRNWVRRTIRSGAIVMIASDGWERGNPDVLGQEMERLRRQCHRLLWLNPLASRPKFEPLTVGLQAALPHVDVMVPCGNLGSLVGLASRLARMI